MNNAIGLRNAVLFWNQLASFFVELEPNSTKNEASRSDLAKGASFSIQLALFQSAAEFFRRRFWFNL